MIKQLQGSASGGLGAQPPASPWSERSEGTDVRRSAEGAGEGRSPKRSVGPLGLFDECLIQILLRHVCISQS